MSVTSFVLRFADRNVSWNVSRLNPDLIFRSMSATNFVTVTMFLDNILIMSQV